MNLSLLTAELAKPAYAGLSDQEAARQLNAAGPVQPVSRFGNLRTLASLLTPDEYVALRAALDQAAAASRLVADMLKMLELPGDEAGNGGGIDFGAAAVRAMIDQLCSAETATKLKTYAERSGLSWAQRNGFPGGVSVGLVARCRTRNDG